MIFLLLNIAAFGLTLALALTVDKKSTGANENTRISNLLFFAAVLYFCMSASIGFTLLEAKQLADIFTKATFTFIGWYSVLACIYIVTFPDKNKKQSLLTNAVKWLLFAGAFIVIFMIPNGLTKLTIESNHFSVGSGRLFPKAPFYLTWLNAYSVVYVFVIPFFALVMSIVKAENTSTRLLKQKRIITGLSFLTRWGLFFYIFIVRAYQPMFLSLLLLCFLPEILLIYEGQVVEETWSIGTIFRAFARFLLRYLIPACIVGAAFAVLWPMYLNNTIVFFAIFIPVVALMMLGWYYTEKFIRSREFLRDNNYASKFEQEITSIDFNEEPKAVIERVFQIFKKTMLSSSMKIFIPAGTDTFNSVYASDEKTDGIKIDPAVFDMLLTSNRQVVFREWAQKNSSTIAVRPQMLKALDDAESDAFIILNEGRQIVSLIFLGRKTTGNIYTDYDRKILNKFYSNLFVIGYYVKNILNEAVIGTVNREIRMSDQIITSIQENMDKIKNDKVDVGYLMVPAHNIGGEFVDMIRLSEQRYIFIIGALSGKGIAASMSMVILKSIIRTFLAETSDFKLLVEKVNNFIRSSLPKGTFFAGIFGLIDFATENLYYVNCGSPALLMYTRAYNNVIEIQGAGRILGFVENIGPLIRVKKVKLSPGDIIMACTDGLIESKSLRGEVFGKQRIQNTIMDNTNYPAERMAKFTYDALVKFTSKELDEDVTIFMIKYLGER
ncbi:MAG: serine/threonine-protein phosphatase [Treponema sp.]|nr:serine/threonine-protein phosphatase [Treponema sp.]